MTPKPGYLGILLFLLTADVSWATKTSSTSTASQESNDDSLEPAAFEDEEVSTLDTVLVTGRRINTARVSGSAHSVTEKELETFEYDDIGRVLSKIAGVYVRDEDGFGLRPNIGLRGASSDRSSKVTLMEDGVLLAPAPYSAPAAYYFPLTTRLEQMEVFKGSGSIRYGPNTIGGALNMRTRSIPYGEQGAIDLGGGQYTYGKAHAHYGYGNDRFGLLLEGARIQSDGFKELDGGGPTGFGKHEAMLKARFNSDPNEATYHRLEVKLGFAEERSNETYLGLSDADFRSNARRRYQASQLGLMDWQRSQAQISYSVAFEESLELSLTLYRNDFDRSWFKLNHLGTGAPALRDIVNRPTGNNAVLLEVIRGNQDSTPGSPAETLFAGNNARKFVSQGLQLDGRWKIGEQNFKETISFGARLHYDRIRRNHTEEAFLMRRGVLVPEGTGLIDVVTNVGETIAFSSYIQDEIGFFDRFFLTPGLRLEAIDSNLTDGANGERKNNSTVLVPGIGAFYKLTPEFGVLAGVHRGFSPVSPGQAEGVQPEKSINYEAGLRYVSQRQGAEVVGFFNDYKNITGECTFSAGCDPAQINTQFNGGQVYVYGAEAVAHQTFEPIQKVIVDTSLSYTLTLSEFQGDFSASNPIFGNVENGDELPYVPKHQMALRVGTSFENWSLENALTFVDVMRDTAGQGPIPENDKTDAQWLWDVSLNYAASKLSDVYLRIDNVLAKDFIVSRRPFGTRPAKPFQIFLGYRHRFGDAS